MQAPKGVNSAVIEGHEYQIKKDGKVKVKNPTHVPVLERHGFTQAMDELSAEELEQKIADMDDKDELVEFIEERGGEADNSMGFKKLRRLAREVVTSDED
jgi:ABC-type Na+ transport system ATPase subunit NatA